MLHEVDEENSPVVDMTHHVFGVADLTAKNELVRALASGTGRRILFMRTKHQAKKLARQLIEAGIPSVDLHGNLSQPQRDRNLAAFAAGEARVLVATDVAARGIDIDNVELVVHVDPPAEHKAYLHRSGRTARAGSSGDVVTVVLPVQKADVAVLLRKAAIAVTPQRVTATSPAVAELVGEVAAYVKPAPRVAAPARGQSQGGRSTGANAQRKQARRGSGAGGGQRYGRSGAPATSGAQQGRRSGALEHKAGAASGRRRDAGADVRGGQGRSARSGGAGQRSFTSYSTSTPAPASSSSGGQRRSGRRAQG
jgi:superfamily II DNA/RNA helicase